MRRSSVSKFGRPGSATTWSPARHEPSESSRKETPLAWRAVRTQPCATAGRPGAAPARSSRIVGFTGSLEVGDAHGEVRALDATADVDDDPGDVGARLRREVH